MRGRSWSRSKAATCSLACLLLPACASFETAPDHDAGVDPLAPDGSAGGADDDGDPDQQPTVTEVPGTDDWVDTGVELSAGEHVRVTAAGAVWFDESVTAVGPEGTPVVDWQEWNIVPCINHASLIGRIGESGEPFLIGPDALFAAHDADRLYLRVNDTKTIDNVGGFEATIETDLPHDTIGTAPVSVASTVAWTDTGVDLATADLVTVSASGTVTLSPTATCDPSGMPDRDDLQGSNVIVCADHGALIGRVGTDGTPFVVGRSESVAAPADGRLYLGVNDTTVGNNAGVFDASLTITDPTP